MIELAYSPKWFFGKDIIIDAISLIVLFLISIFSIRCYKLSKKKNYLYFAASLILMALSFAFKIITNFTLLYHTVEIRQLGILTLTYRTIQSSDVLFVSGFLMYRLLMLLGLYVLYSLYVKQDKAGFILVPYLIFVSTYFTRNAYYLFYITCLIFLVIITWQYYQNYMKNKHLTNKLLLISFGVITLSQIIFIFVSLNSILYVIAEIIQTLGYIGLFITFVKVIKDGKKKGKK